MVQLCLGDFTLDLKARAYVMGILNVTPDSFWGGGRFIDTGRALQHARQMVEDGADIIDVGGESTRPGSDPIDTAEELKRIAPVVEELVKDHRVPVSVDTRRGRVAEEMLGIGAHMINDVSGLTFDQAMPEVVRRYDVPVVIMHMRGTPEIMQSLADYEDVVVDVRRELAERIAVAEGAGIRPANILIDPGIGFAKTAQHCVDLISRLDEFLQLGKPLVLGPSRKSFMGATLGLGPKDRLEATIASCIVGVSKGASLVRVHDVAGVSRALKMFELLRSNQRGRETKVLD